MPEVRHISARELVPDGPIDDTTVTGGKTFITFWDVNIFSDALYSKAILAFSVTCHVVGEKNAKYF